MLITVKAQGSGEVLAEFVHPVGWTSAFVETKDGRRLPVVEVHEGPDSQVLVVAGA